VADRHHARLRELDHGAAEGRSLRLRQDGPAAAGAGLVSRDHPLPLARRARTRAAGRERHDEGLPPARPAPGPRGRRSPSRATASRSGSSPSPTGCSRAPRRAPCSPPRRRAWRAS
jgi:hypothetical protein